MTFASADPATDLRRLPLGALRAIDFRAPSRDPWADEAMLWDRLLASWAGLDDAAWAAQPSQVSLPSV